MKIKVSVIIPIYNVEKYIERCVRSLMQQSLQEIEFIFVDDCSQDSSITILENTLSDYPQRISQIKILHHHRNLGLIAARKTGLNEAVGEYIIHCDSDDWIESEMYEDLYNKAITDNADIVSCNFYDGDEDDYIIRYQNYGIDKESIIKALLMGKKHGALWLHLVRRDLCFHDSLIFPIAVMCEDLIMTLQFYYYSNKISHVDRPLYFYRSNLSSISKSSNPSQLIKQAKEMELNINNLSSFFCNNNFFADLDEYIMYRKFFTKRWIQPALLKFRDCKIWSKIHSEINSNIFKNSLITYKEKLVAILILLRLYPILKRLK